MPPYDKIDYSVDAGRAEVFLNRPEVLNAYDDEMLVELDSCLEDAMNDDSVRVVVLSGRGQAFCSGVDLGKITDHAQTRKRFEEHRARVDSVYRLLHKGSKPTIAAVNGSAVGAGFGFALSCDIRLVAEDAVMRDQHLNVGLPPSVGAGLLLPKLVGASKAREFVLISEEITPAEAADCGLARDVIKPGETMIAARELAERLSEKSATAMRGTIDLMNSSRSFEEYVRSASEWQWTCKDAADGSDSPAPSNDGSSKDGDIG